ncbi:MAG TPA: response regulator [Labilithrix sp.]|nr:response regulator [Labilithrix sp.]
MGDQTHRVLLVEDYEDSRVLYTEYLESLGYEVDTAADGVEALTKAREAPPDIIVLDLALPRMDGWELARELRKDARTSRICIIAATGHGGEPYVARAFDSGCDEVLVKPLEPAMLRERIERALFVRRTG